MEALDITIVLVSSVTAGVLSYFLFQRSLGLQPVIRNTVVFVRPATLTVRGLLLSFICAVTFSAILIAEGIIWYWLFLTGGIFFLALFVLFYKHTLSVDTSTGKISHASLFHLKEKSYDAFQVDFVKPGFFTIVIQFKDGKRLIVPYYLQGMRFFLSYLAEKNINPDGRRKT